MQIKAAGCRARIRYPQPIEEARRHAGARPCGTDWEAGCNSRWAALRLLDGDEALGRFSAAFLGCDLLEDQEVTARLTRGAGAYWRQDGIPPERLQDALVSGIVLRAEEVCMEAVVL